jgi:MFS family permease
MEGTGAKPMNWLALFAIGIATVTIANDFSAINVALPTMEGDFHTNINTIQWVVNAYALTFGVMIVTGGRLADMFGRRNTFFLGAVLFAVFSAAGGAAPNESILILTRALMGIGAALMLPAIIGMTYALLPKEKAGLAGGIIIGAAGLGNAIGPMVGGVFTDLLTWRWIFFLNVPIAAFAIAVIWASVHLEEAEDADHRLDYPGIASISIGLVSLLIALDQVDDWGWGDPRVLALLAIAVIGIVAFVPLERRAGRHALVPPEIIANRGFAASCVAILCLSVTFFSALLYRPSSWRSSSASRRSKRARGFSRRWRPSRSSPSSPGRSTRGSGRSGWRPSAPPACARRGSSSRWSATATATARWSRG